MFLYQVVIVIAIVGLLLFLVNRYIPMQGQIKGILNGVVVIVLVIWLLKVFGFLTAIMQYRAMQG
jgi:1-acyl-sn-glycerol-3-phosphate acyltransferase